MNERPDGFRGRQQTVQIQIHAAKQSVFLRARAEAEPLLFELCQQEGIDGVGYGVQVLNLGNTRSADRLVGPMRQFFRRDVKFRFKRFWFGPNGVCARGNPVADQIDFGLRKQLPFVGRHLAIDDALEQQTFVRRRPAQSIRRNRRLV